ncbi:hypothetical protein D3C84_837530 [compost metagenome]
MRLLARRAVTHDGRVGDVVIGFRFHQQHIPGECRASMQGAIAVGAHQRAAVIAQVELVQIPLWRVPFIVAIQRRHPQGQPSHGPQRREDRGQVTAITGADHGNGRCIERRVRQQAIVGRQQVTQIIFAGHPRQGNAGAAGVAAQVERQTDTSQACDPLGPLQVPLLTTAPAVHKQHAGDLRFGTEERPAHLFIVDVDLNAFASSRHRI